MRVAARFTPSAIALWLVAVAAGTLLTWAFGRGDRAPSRAQAEGDLVELDVQEIEVLYGLAPLDAGPRDARAEPDTIPEAE